MRAVVCVHPVSWSCNNATVRDSVVKHWGSSLMSSIMGVVAAYIRDRSGMLAEITTYTQLPATPND